MSLPTELVHVIALHLQWDTTSLYRLSLLDVQTYQLLLPIRFRRVQLKSSLAVLSFCSAISSSRDPGLYVQTLRIGKRPGLFNPKPWLFHEELGSALRAALLRMPRLSNLSLISTTSGFNKCFDRLDLPFSLQRLEICCINSEPFFSLLRSQSSIKELWLIVMHSQNLNDFYNFFAVNKDILPHLSTVAAPELLLDVTMVDRPVSSIVFDYRGWPFPGFWRRLEGENYGPIHSLGIISFGSYVFKSCLDPWLCLVGNPPVHGIDGNIRQLTVFDPSMTDTENITRELIFPRLKMLRDLGGYPNLERIDFTLADEETELDISVSSRLGDFRWLDTWQKFVPTLRGASVYGVEMC